MSFTNEKILAVENIKLRAERDTAIARLDASKQEISALQKIVTERGDEIDRLRNDDTEGRLRVDLSRLRAANEKMAEALKPLAEAAYAFDWVIQKGLDTNGVGLWGEQTNISTIKARRITVSDTMRARDALREHEAGKKFAK